MSKIAAQKILFIVQAAPYGNETNLTALRLAATLAQHEAHPKLRLFLISDAVMTALSGQNVADGMSHGEMLNEIIKCGAEVRVCRSCITSRGLLNASWLPDVALGTMPELAQWVLEAEQVLTF